MNLKNKAPGKTSRPTLLVTDSGQLVKWHFLDSRCFHSGFPASVGGVFPELGEVFPKLQQEHWEAGALLGKSWNNISLRCNVITNESSQKEYKIKYQCLWNLQGMHEIILNDCTSQFEAQWGPHMHVIPITCIVRLCAPQPPQPQANPPSTFDDADYCWLGWWGS